MRPSIIESMHPHLRDLYRLWEERGWIRHTPTWDEVVKAGLGSYSSNLVVIQVEEPHGYVYRYYGRHFAESFGRDLTNQILADLPADILPEEQRSLLESEYRYARARKRPAWRSYTAEFDGRLKTWQRLIMPASSDGKLVDMILIGAYETTEGEA